MARLMTVLALLVIATVIPWARYEAAIELAINQGFIAAAVICMLGVPTVFVMITVDGWRQSAPHHQRTASSFSPAPSLE